MILVDNLHLALRKHFLLSKLKMKQLACNFRRHCSAWKWLNSVSRTNQLRSCTTCGPQWHS